MRSPHLGESAQLALTLRLLGGLSAAQVGRVLGVGEATVAARLTRAKKTIAMVRTSPDELHPDGVAPVLTAVHAMFNTGHNTIHDTDPIPVGLSPRSLHLARLLASLLPGDREVRGLLAWILLTDARTPARAACRDRLPLLAEQDRSRWDRAKLREGLALARTLRPARGRFAVMAQLAAVHAEAPTWQHTDWHRVSRLYGRLRQVWTHPVLAIHQAVAVGLADGPEAGLTRLPADQLIDAYLSAARGDMLYRLGHTADAAIAYRFAAAAADNPYEQRLLADRGHDMDRAARTTPVPFAPVEVLPAFPTTGRTR